MKNYHSIKMYILLLLMCLESAMDSKRCKENACGGYWIKIGETIECDNPGYVFY